MIKQKFEVKNLLPKKKQIKINWALTLFLAVLALIILFITLSQAIKKAEVFFEINTIKFNQIVKIEFNKPLEVVSREQIKKEVELEQKAEDITNKCMEGYIKSLTPTPKQKSSIIKPVQAFSFSYPKYSDTPNYKVIISKLKNLYINWEYAAELIGKESSFDIGAINPSSGACGLVQALPCKKMNCSLSNIDCQLNWQKEYIANRYGTVEKALQFWNTNKWY